MKRISSTMNFIFKKAVYGCVVLGCAVTMVACDSLGIENLEDIVRVSGVNNPLNANMPDVPTEEEKKFGTVKLYLEETEDGHPDYKTVNAGRSASSATVTYSRSGDKNLKLLTKEQIEGMLKDSDPSKWPANYYSANPDYSIPQYAGALTEEALLSGLNRVNVIRRLSGVRPVFIDAEYTRKAQLGALMLHYRGNKLDHDLGNTPRWGMGTKDFADGNEALGHGNLANYNLPASADNWLQDPGQNTSQQAGIGHRIWMTAPVAAKFGFGYMGMSDSSSRSAYVPVESGSAVLRACDSGASGSYDWDFVAWPAPGYTPLGLWAESHVRSRLEGDPNDTTVWTSMWSVYFRGGNNIHTLTLEKLGGSGKKWEATISRNPGDDKKPFSVTIKKGDGFDENFAVYTGTGPGATNAQAISFHPTAKEHTYNDGDKYKVTLAYGYGGGAGTKYEYIVEFFDPTEVAISN